MTGLDHSLAPNFAVQAGKTGTGPIWPMPAIRVLQTVEKGL